MFTNRSFNVLIVIAFVVVVALTIREAFLTSAVAHSVQPYEVQRSQRSLEAERARWVAMGEYYTAKQAQEALLVQRVRDAEKARWVAMGEYYLEKQAKEAPRSQRSLDAERARWVAMGEYYTAKAEAAISPSP